MFRQGREQGHTNPISFATLLDERVATASYSRGPRPACALAHWHGVRDCARRRRLLRIGPADA